LLCRRTPSAPAKVEIIVQELSKRKWGSVAPKPAANVGKKLVFSLISEIRKEWAIKRGDLSYTTRLPLPCKSIEESLKPNTPTFSGIR